MHCLGQHEYIGNIAACFTNWRSCASLLGLGIGRGHRSLRRWNGWWWSRWGIWPVCLVWHALRGNKSLCESLGWSTVALWSLGRAVWDVGLGDDKLLVEVWWWLMDNVTESGTLIGQLLAQAGFDQANAKVKLGESLSKNSNNKFGGASGQEFDNGRVTRWNIFFLTPLHHCLGDVVIWGDHLNLSHLAVWMEEGGKASNWSHCRWKIGQKELTMWFNDDFVGFFFFHLFFFIPAAEWWVSCLFGALFSRWSPWPIGWSACSPAVCFLLRLTIGFRSIPS